MTKVLCTRSINSRTMGALFSRFATADMAGPEAEFVRSTLSANKVVIFSKSYCPYCDMAKEQFQKLNYTNVTTIELNKRNDGTQIQAILGEMTGATTVPRVFIDGKFIGGGTDVKKLYQDGSLQKMLA